MQMRELHSSKTFRTDYKKLNKAETAETDIVIQNLVRISSHTNIFDISKSKK